MASRKHTQCQGCTRPLPSDAPLRGYCSTLCARLHKPLPRVATQYLAEDYPLLFSQRQHSPIGRRRSASPDDRRRSRQASGGWAAVRRAVLVDRAFRADRGQGRYFPDDYDAVAAARLDMELCTPGAQAANSPIYKRQTTRKSSKTRLVDTHFVAPPDAPPVPSLVVTPAPPSRRADSANSNSGSGARLVASLKNLTIDTPTELNGGRSYPNAQYLTVDRSYGDASGRSWVNTRAGRVSRAGSIEPRRALSLSSVPPSPASQYSQYSDGKELVLGEDSPVLVPERHTIDSVGFDRLLSASPRDTTGHFNINEATESPVSPVPPVSPKTYLSPPPSSFRTGHFSRSASGTSSRLGPNFRASAWQGSEPKDIWQTVRALRNDDQDEADPNDKLLNRSTLYSEY